MHIPVRFLSNNKTIVLEAAATDTVLYLKALIHVKVGIPIDQLILRISESALNDTDTVS